jgi:putative nucleotidyltransferase with HDIG domain
MRARATVVVALVLAAITTAHGLVGHAMPGLHLVHLVFGALYLVPTVAAALWIRPAAAVIASLVAATAYLACSASSGTGEPAAHASRLAMAVVYLLVGSVSAALVHLADRERQRHAEAERRAEREAVVQAIASLSNALRSRDQRTAAHSEDVARIAEAIARRMDLDPGRVDTVRLAGLVHDVGKIGVRDDVLLKEGTLSTEERSAVEKHPIIAAEILAPIRGGEELAKIVAAHHEAPDGSGYPARLTADEIALEAAILRVADVFVALTEHRPYKPEIPPERALEMMRSWTGKLEPAALCALEAVVVAPGSAPGEAAPPRGRS